MIANTKLRCEVCGFEGTTDFAHSLSRGWPTCHGYTMRLISTEADIPSAVARVVADQLPRSENQHLAKPNEETGDDGDIANFADL